MKRIKVFYSIISLLLSVFLTLNTYSQSDFTAIRLQFDKYSQNSLQEKIYAHTDKATYLAGELLWFKLYNVDADFHELIDVSKVAYAEVLNKDHIPVIQAKIALNHGTGNGSFELPVDINTGNYFFRVYTNWMKNFDADLYFEKPISIINTLKNDGTVETNTSQSKYDIQFFPEGGNLVNGIESKVGFRVVDAEGKGIDYNGILTNQNGDTVAHYSSFKFGIGSFLFRPLKNNNFKATITLADGSIVSKELPTAYDNGYVLHVEKRGEKKISVKVESSPDLNGQGVYIFIHSHRHTIETHNATLNNNVAEFILDDDKLGDGISHITVFNSEKKPVCERLYFKSPVHQLNIEATTSQQQYDSRKKVAVDILSKDETGAILPADLSVSVYHLDSLASLQQNNIQSYLWLSSDLKGNVESPAYYFTNTNEETAKALDNLMLTHGWRRFKWDDVLLFDKPSFFFIPEYDGHVIPAVVIQKDSTSRTAKNIESFLTIPGKYFQFYTSESNEKGEVNFYTKNFYGKHEIFAQAGAKSRNYRIDIKSPFSENYSSRTLPSFYLQNTSGIALQTKSVNAQVQKTYWQTQHNKFVSPPIDTGFFYEPTKTYPLDDYVRFPTMEEVLREYVGEIVVHKQNNALSLEAGRRDYYGIVYRYVPLTMVDGIPLFDDPDKIFSYDPLKIKALDIINRKFVFGKISFEGIINFITYKGNPDSFAIDPHLTVVDYEALQLQREFFAPVYETQNQIDNRMPDFRELLYWTPSLQTNASGKAQLNFYTSDMAGKYVVFIEGLGADGRAGTKAFSIDVVNPMFVNK
jgi:hypothetical protein